MSLFARILIFFILIAHLGAVGQDIHFSQFTGSLLNLTPGYTGFYDGDYRVSAIYRSQWQSVPVKYNTISLSGEKVISPLALENDLIGVGLVFNSDRAGDARYGTTQAYAKGSYIFKSFTDTSWRVSGGIGLGWNQVGFDFSKMNFDAQYDGLVYNRALSSTEQFQSFTRNYFDCDLGFAGQKKLQNRSTFSFGVGLFHLTRPNISFNGSETSRLDLKFTTTLSYNWYLNKKTDLLAEALLSFQGKYKEIIPNLSAKYFLDRAENTAILGGLSFRAKDALIAKLGYSKKLLSAGVSYDVNISKFTAATNYRGGFEIYVVQIINAQPAFTAKRRSCPSFL